MSAAIDKREVADALREALNNVVADECFVFDAVENNHRPAVLSGSPDAPDALENAARRIQETKQADTIDIDGRTYYFEPVFDQNTVAAVLALRFPDRSGPSHSEHKALVGALVQQASLALARTRLVNELQTERLEKERELLRSALLSSISHDLRTPLSAMIGSTTSLIDLDASLDAGQKRELLDAILEEARRLDRYIQNLLDMTRLGYQGLRLDRDWTGLDEILHVTLKRLQPLTRGHVIERRLPPDLPPLHVHAGLVEQAIFNVLENAVKFSADGTRIGIEASNTGDKLQIDISDQGPGIAEPQRRDIFNMFFTSPRGDRQSAGTGLGLAICQGVINAHGGRVEAFDGPGGVGLTVRLTLPVVAYEPSGAEPAKLS